jgi:hypothetical protein
MIASEALNNASTCTAGNRSLFSGKLSELRATMRQDLRTSETSNVRGLDGAAYAKIVAPARDAEGGPPAVELPGPAPAADSYQAGAPNTPR